MTDLRLSRVESLKLPLVNIYSPMEIKKFTPDHCEILKEDYLWYVSAPPGAGKTVAVSWVCSLPQMQNRFSCVIVISPTSNLGAYKQFQFVDSKYHYTPDRLEEVLANVKRTQLEIRNEHPDARLLIICDDMFGHSRSLGQTSTALQDFVSIRRHYGVSMILISQHIKACTPVIRNSAYMFTSFLPRRLEDRIFIANNFLTKQLINHSRRDTMRYAEQIMDKAFESSEYAALCVDCVSKSRIMLDNVYVMVAEPIKKFKMKLKKIVMKEKKKPEDIEDEQDYGYSFCRC